jgi:hypothetical protein
MTGQGIQGRFAEALPKALPWWRRVPIHTKLQLSVVGFSLIVLLACAASLIWAANSYFHGKIHQDLSMLAGVLADNLTASVMFDDKGSASDILAALKKNEHITRAAVYKDAGLFTAYPNDVNNIQVDDLPDEGVWLRQNHYFASVPIGIAGETLGRLVLVSDLDEWTQIRTGLYFLFSGLFIGLLLLTRLLSAWLRKHISEPLEA